MQRVSFRTLGCKVNQYETAAMKERLAGAGYRVVPNDSQADICIINTCTVTGKSDVSSRQLVRQAIRRNSGSRVIVTGCYAQSDPEALKNIEGVAEVIGNQDKTRILEIITGSQNLREKPGTGAPSGFGNRSRAFLMIQDGCEAECSYCIVPEVRGQPRSRPGYEVLSELKELASAGFRETVLTGIHIGGYRNPEKKGSGLTGLLQRALELPEVGRIRLSSIEPNEVTDNLIKLFGHPKLCRHLHLPLQSGSNRTLKLMRRKYRAEDYLNLINRLTESIPGIGLGADVMVGFPGETDHDFQSTCNLIEGLPYSYLHVFAYSPRRGTAAASMKDQVPAQVKKERSALLRKLADRKKKLYQQKSVGQTLQCVLINKSDTINGLSDNYLEVDIFPEKISWPQAKNSIVSIKITDYVNERLTGTPLF